MSGCLCFSLVTAYDHTVLFAHLSHNKVSIQVRLPKVLFSLWALYIEGVVVRAFDAWQGIFSQLTGGERTHIVEHGSLVL